MQAIAVILLLCLAGSASAAGVQEQAKISAIQKVLQMMDDMLAKGKEEKQAETVEFAKYKMFCQKTTAQKLKQIAKEKEDIVQLKAEIDQSAADATTAAKEIAQIDSDVATWESEKADADKVREKARADYMSAHAEYEESVAATGRALETLKAGPATVGQAALLQVSVSHLVPAETKKRIDSFLQRGQSKVSAPEANAFESSSGGITEMVEDLGDKFKSEMKDLEKAETKEAQDHELLMADVIDQIEDGKKESEEKKGYKMQRESDGGAAKSALADTEQALETDTKFLKDLMNECQANSEDYEQRQVARAGEIEAIGKAIEIMSDVKSPKLVQVGQATALAQLRSLTTSQAVKQALVKTFLADRAKATSSRILSLLSTKAGAAPFKKVTKMIEDMIYKLMEEANEEAEHKGFCDTEMGTNKATRDQKSQEVEKLTATSEELTADISKLAEEIADLSAAIGTLDTEVAEATAIRTEEKTKNAATIADAKAGQEATMSAIQVLKDYYEKASLLQESNDSDDTPSNFQGQAAALVRGDASSLVQEPYTGMASGGIVGMLETIESDFARIISETDAGEKAAAKVFEKFTSDSDQDKAVKSADLGHKNGAKAEKESKLQSTKKDLATSQEGLDAALAYFEKLKPSCVDAGVSYEDRVAQRKAEIESLKEALQILEEG